jgi:hypothetical protein
MFRTSALLAGLFSAPLASAQTPSAPPPSGKGLDRAAISAGIMKVKPQILACGDANKSAGGTVKVTTKVAPDGKVTSASQQGASDPKLGDCVVAVMKKATFAKTDVGGSFSYPFVFGAPKPPTAGAGSGAPPTAIPPVPPGQGSASPPPSSGPPESIDRTMISTSIARLKAKIAACGQASPSAKGTVKVMVNVAPAGTVTSATISASPDKKLGDCVAAEMKKATFDKTQKGGSFSYPFVF